MGGFNENATEDLLKEARESREGGIERSGKRAENSLLYEAFPQAKKEEDKVAENLEQLQEGLEVWKTNFVILAMELCKNWPSVSKGTWKIYPV
jgi:hypothetical protein